MNTNRFLIVLVLLLSFIKSAFGEEALLAGVSFVSPDGRYCVQLEVIDRLLRFIIKDIQSGRLDHSIQSTGPLYLHWAANSKSFVTVEHTVKGSYGRVALLEGNRWLSVEVDPPSEGKMDAKVIKLELRPDSVHYKFAVTKLTPDWTPIDYWFCDLDVSLETGKMSNVKWTSTSETALAATLWPHEPEYQPPMGRERYYDVCK
jgi:hypothetical protein